LNLDSREENVLSELQIETFRALGVLVLPGALDGVTLGGLVEEVDAAIAGAGPRDTAGGGITGHYIPAGDRPASAELVERFQPLAEELLGRDAFPVAPFEILYFDEAWWHTDLGPELEAVKVATYLETLDARNGALRVLPGTHLIDQHTLGVLHRLNPHQVPCHVIESKPGDLIVFHMRLWHAALNGHDRRQWSVEYFAFPESDHERAELAKLEPEWREEPEWGPVRPEDIQRLLNETRPPEAPGRVSSGRTTQRKPMWQVDVSTVSAWRAAGR
jgi:hypothetical protein